MPVADLSFELEVNRAKVIVRVRCVKDPPENAAVFVGKHLDAVLKWDSAPSGGFVEGTLPGGKPCHFTVSRAGEYVVFAVHWSSPECVLECRGSVATLDRTVDMLEALKGERYTLMVGKYDHSQQNVMEEPPMYAGLRLLMRNLGNPKALVCSKGTDLFAAMPRVDVPQLEMCVSMFHADCRIEFAERHKWKFGAKMFGTPLRFQTAYEACREQAAKVEMFDREDLRDAG
jgi:hypothetical protein